MRTFEGFQRKALIIVPSDEEFKTRVEKRNKEQGKDLPDHAVYEMKGKRYVCFDSKLTLALRIWKPKSKNCSSNPKTCRCPNYKP